MKTLHTLMIAIALTGTTQIASANGGGGSYYSKGVPGTTYVGYWRTYDRWNNIVKDDDMYQIHDQGWNYCWSQCKGDSYCTGVEYAEGSNYNRCEVHYDKFAACKVTHNNNGKNGADMSTCWVKGYEDSPGSGDTSYTSE